jgi:hypothetical protein
MRRKSKIICLIKCWRENVIRKLKYLSVKGSLRWDMKTEKKICALVAFVSKYRLVEVFSERTWQLCQHLDSSVFNCSLKYILWEDGLKRRTFKKIDLSFCPWVTVPYQSRFHLLDSKIFSLEDEIKGKIQSTENLFKSEHQFNECSFFLISCTPTKHSSRLNIIIFIDNKRTQASKIFIKDMYEWKRSWKIR